MTERRSDIDDKIAAMLAKSAPAPPRRMSAHGGCGGKDAYTTEADARAVALMNGTAGRLWLYRCDMCELWHFTKRRD